MQQLTQRYLAAKRALFDRVYDELNTEQRAAVFAVNKAQRHLRGGEATRRRYERLKEKD